VRAGEVKRIVVWRLDRLGRTARGILELCDELQTFGVTLVSLKEGIDLSTPAGRLMISILASMAQFETEVRGERVKAGIAAAKARGQKWGGSKKGPRKLTPAVCRKVGEWRGKGKTIVWIRRHMRISERACYYALRWLEDLKTAAKSTPPQKME